MFYFSFRNLYAIFYKATHPDVTEAEFGEIYKYLDKEKIKVCFRSFCQVSTILIGVSHEDL